MSTTLLTEQIAMLNMYIIVCKYLCYGMTRRETYLDWLLVHGHKGICYIRHV